MKNEKHMCATLQYLIEQYVFVAIGSLLLSAFCVCFVGVCVFDCANIERNYTFSCIQRKYDVNNVRSFIMGALVNNNHTNLSKSTSSHSNGELHNFDSDKDRESLFRFIRVHEDLKAKDIILETSLISYSATPESLGHEFFLEKTV